MSATANDVLVELAKNAPGIVTGLGTLCAAVASSWALIESKRTTRIAKRGARAAEESVAATLAQNPTIEAVHDAVTNTQPSPDTVVVVEAPTSTESRP